MPEIRKDPLTGQWLLLAAERSGRGNDFLDERNGAVAECLFCPGQEGETPPAVLSYPDDENWRVRVVPNKYPGAVPDATVEEYRGAGDVEAAYGTHEVIIETRDHKTALADFEPEQITELLQIYQKRICALKSDARLRFVVIFKNHGERAGASRAHSHSQLLSLPSVPTRVERELQAAARYREQRGECFYCRMLAEDATASREVMDGVEVKALSPYVPRFPFETWILPKQHASHFECAEGAVLRDLGEMLRELLRRIRVQTGIEAYNLVLQTAPLQTAPLDYYHWRAEVIPRRGALAGLELGTGVYMHETGPEEAASILRGESPEEGE